MPKIIKLPSFQEIQDLSGFQERGSEFKVKARREHRSSSYGILEAPKTLIQVKGVQYEVIPIDGFKEDFFTIEKGALGTLVNLGFYENTSYPVFARITWDKAVQVYYKNALYSRFNKNDQSLFSLDSFFEVFRADPDTH